MDNTAPSYRPEFAAQASYDDTPAQYHAQEEEQQTEGLALHPASPSLHDRLAAERHVPRPVPSLGLEDAGALDLAAVEAAAGLGTEEAAQLRRQAQDEVLAELKGEVTQRRQAVAGESQEMSHVLPHRHHQGQPHRHHGIGEERGPGSEAPDRWLLLLLVVVVVVVLVLMAAVAGALLKFARAVAAERHESVRHVLETVPAVPVDIRRLDSKSDGD
ncbi:hypothetical protein VOLCADRAFT_92537 [Volvox carteri f. nagariensis]|uniref:Uncharacterized protein n=1 Tax=Volvox carteri f. nagariensis TaxID=3068 RepID=D8TZX4_VOLCA|nr:uncharacterized protein VOLCADRAFT_92537 [Volvox carteri f. nagariensis]EFJ47003.1 hypothetical protein VOLCADRAFT_92537 [Volvox carteri f. nagariensis]|eukprot:XP_002951898.1 hypothetical protein VOLCADRAFT_92537 [Volvox carteri f. nagariensis]